jgi:hypothetical protein
MVKTILPEADMQLKIAGISRLMDVLDRLPAEKRAEVWRHIALNLAARLNCERIGVGA